MGPPEGILPIHLVLLEVLSHAPSLIERQRVPILLEERVDSWNTAIPCIFQIFQGQPSVLCIRLLTFQCVLSPHALTVNEFSFPSLDVPVQIRNQLVLFVAQAAAIMGDAHLRLFGIPQIGLRDEDVAHAEHTETAKLLRCVEHHRWETRRHLGIQSNFDSGLDLILTLNQKVQQGICVNHGLSEVGHHADEVRVPFVGNLRECR
mmetsp:Transcript_29941/g.79798  ORF Transcript_29941/g.79798 Transcript_29941/m.79798 type:complete len:205 (-) Transcript_29941:4024-4638(-)